MNKLLSCLALLGALGASAAGVEARAASASSPDADGIAAVVGNQVITRYDLGLRVRELQQQAAQQPGAAAPPADQLRQQALQDMINEYALAEYAEQSGLGVSDDTLRQAVAQIAASNHLSVDQLRSQVQGQGLGWQDFQAQIRRQILIGRLRQRDVAGKVSVSDQEVDDYLSRLRSVQGDSVLHLAQIFVPLPDQATAQQVDEARARIEQAESALRQGRSFQAVAQTFAQGAGGAREGDLGERKAADWPALFVQAVHDLQPGQVSAVIRSPAGFHILELVARQSSSELPSTAMQAQVREIVLRADSEDARKAAVRELQAVQTAVQDGQVAFAEKAHEISQDMATASHGGELGWVLPGQLPAALDAAVAGLNPGDVSQPIVTPGQVVLLQLVDRREHALEPGQERAVARSALLQRKAAKAFEDLVQDVRARTYVRLPDDDS